MLCDRGVLLKKELPRPIRLDLTLVLLPVRWSWEPARDDEVRDIMTEVAMGGGGPSKTGRGFLLESEPAELTLSGQESLGDSERSGSPFHRAAEFFDNRASSGSGESSWRS